MAKKEKFWTWQTVMLVLVIAGAWLMAILGAVDNAPSYDTVSGYHQFPGVTNWIPILVMVVAVVIVITFMSTLLWPFEKKRKKTCKKR